MENRITLGESHFDENARRWDENPVFQERGRQIAAAIRELVPLNPSMTALDYGCGTGLLSFPMKDELGAITLADSSAGMLAVLTEKIAAQGVPNMSVRKLDLLTDPLPNERYGLIYTAMTLHHIPDTDRILGIFHTLLKPGGYLCIADLDKEDGSFHGIEVDVHHGFDRDDLAKKVKRDGYNDIRFRTAFEIVKEQEAGPRAYPVFLMAARRT
jgi:ubiquinone/menaquinone biosynthesis C-methylase UbiE